MLAKNTRDKYRKNNECNKNQDLKKRRQEGPRNVRKYRKNRKSNKDFFLLAKNTRDKYRKNRKNNKSNKNQDLETEEAKKGPEMSANIAKIAKVTRISHAKSPANTPFYCLKFAPFCERHSFLCIVAVC